MDTSPSSHPGSPAAKISTPPTPGGNHSSEVDHPPRRRRRCPPRPGSVGDPTNPTTTTSSGRMSVTNSETVEDADMECSDGEAVDTEDEEDEDDDDDEDDEDEDDDYDIYYNNLQDIDDDGERGGANSQFNNNDDPEYFAYECLSIRDTEKLFQDEILALSEAIKISPSDSKILLQVSCWSVEEAMKKRNSKVLGGPSSQLAAAGATAQLLPSSSSQQLPIAQSSSSTKFTTYCEVCAVNQPTVDFSFLACRHPFCKGCWEMHFECQILRGISTSMSCMSANCDTLAPDEFVLRHVNKEQVRDKYNQLTFQDHVRSHPQLRFCPGNNCKYIIRAVKCLAKRVSCASCKSSFCFQCGGEYHAPTDCDTIKRWLTKCADDSETANYISAHTKDCPKCSICIEKNGGCNHMQCYNCKHDFCWMCLGDWKTHGSEYYECSRYKENPNIAHESAHAQAREALKKYLHYFERWENHSKSMKLEAQTLAKIRSRINEKVMGCCGTWIDWQYLLDAAALLAKCRYTLQYTYPYAYYMEPSPRKELFEYQQAQLEAEIENLSWKIEHAETTDRGDLENQIDIAEKRRTSLLKDFLPS